MQEREGIHLPRMRGSVGPFTSRDGKVARIEPSVLGSITTRHKREADSTVDESTGWQVLLQWSLHTLCEVYKIYFPGGSKLLWPQELHHGESRCDVMPMHLASRPFARRPQLLT